MVHSVQTGLRLNTQDVLPRCSSVSQDFLEGRKSTCSINNRNFESWLKKGYHMLGALLHGGTSLFFQSLETTWEVNSSPLWWWSAIELIFIYSCSIVWQKLPIYKLTISITDFTHLKRSRAFINYSYYLLILLSLLWHLNFLTGINKSFILSYNGCTRILVWTKGHHSFDSQPL